MSGGSKKQIVGYRYYLGVHMGLGRGPVNALVQIEVGDRVAWSLTGAGQTGGGGGIGGGGGGSACPEPDALILLAGGEKCRAGDLKPGMVVWTRPAAGGDYGPFAVTGVKDERNDRFCLTLADGRQRRYSRNHRLLTEDRGFARIQTLKAGDRLVGPEGGAVLDVEYVGWGPVVKITVADAQTYVADGLISHNVKPIDEYDVPGGSGYFDNIVMNQQV